MGGQSARNNDEEVAGELLRIRTRKRCVYIAAFAVFQVIVILVFSLVFMRVRAPEVALRNVQIQKIDATANSSSPSFSIHVAAAEVIVKNKNFGYYKFPNSTAQFIYEGHVVGTADVAKRKVGMKSSKTSELSASLSSEGLPGDALQAVATDVGSGRLVVGVKMELKGKVGLMLGMMKKKRGAKMNCTMAIVLASKSVENLVCD